MLLLLSGAVGLLGGCVPEGGGPYRGISTELHNVTERNGQYIIEMNPEVGVGGDWEPFRNVSVVIKSEGEKRICSHFLGDITKSGDYERLTITCDEFPHKITYEIEGDPCDPNTSVGMSVYDPQQELWVSDDISCDG